MKKRLKEIEAYVLVRFEKKMVVSRRQLMAQVRMYWGLAKRTAQEDLDTVLDFNNLSIVKNRLVKDES